jgi:5'-nucleotidase
MSKAKRDMRILVTNDDGIHAPGLTVLEAIAAELSDDVWVVAPEFEQSGASHSLTLHMPLRVRNFDRRRFAVTGTPTDSVMMGVNFIIEGRAPDLVLSGVNRGANAADDVTYSGTVAGAMEGATLGIPSIALSQQMNMRNGETPTFLTAARHGARVVGALLKAGWPERVLLNVNFPNRADTEHLDIEVTRQGHWVGEALSIEERTDMRGERYYWFGFGDRQTEPGEGTDLHALKSGRISVTPLHLDLTHVSSLTQLAGSLARVHRRVS